MNAAAPPPSAPWLDWGVATCLSACLGWTTLGLGGYRPETMLAPALIIAALVVVLLLARALGVRREPFDPVGLWLLPFLVYAGLNAAFLSPVPWLGWADWMTWAMLAAVHWLALSGLDHAPARRLVLGTLAAVAVVSVGLACYQRWFDPDWLMLGRTQTIYFSGRTSGAFGIPNSQAAMLLLLLPVAMASMADAGLPAKRRILAAGLGLIYLFGLYLTISRGAWLSFALALVLWPLLAPGRRWQARVGLAASALVGSLLVGLALYSWVPSVQTRFDALVVDRGEATRPIMWRGAWALFREQPATGSGAGSYNILFEQHRPAGFRDEPQWAHNDYLNTLSDYGLVGVALLAVGLGWAAAHGVRRGALRDRAKRAIAIGVVGFGLSLIIDFHLKIPALAMFLAVALAEGLRRPRADQPSVPVRPAARAWAFAAALGVAGLGAVKIAPHYQAEAARYGPRREIDGLAGSAPDSPAARATVARGLAAFERALAANPANAQAWSDRAYALALSAHAEPARTRELGEQSEGAARRAIALAPVVPEFWWRLGVALDMQGRWAEAGAPFATALSLAPHSALAWYHQAYHYSLKPATHALARTAAATSLQMDGGHHPAAELLRQLEPPR